MTKKRQFFFPGKIGSAAPADGPPHFFPNSALLKVNPAWPSHALEIIRQQSQQSRSSNHCSVAGARCVLSGVEDRCEVL